MPLHKKLKSLAACWLVLAALLVGCRRGGEMDEDSIDVQPIAESDPGADRPRVHFPEHLRQPDPALNAFVQRVMEICERGDYDGFCQLFGTTDVPPSQDDFTRIWHGIRDISLRSIHRADTDPPQYFIHAVARLRKEDVQKRLSRDIVIRVYRELDQWRISGAPKEISRRVLNADSQPASAPADGDSPAVDTAPEGR